MKTQSELRRGELECDILAKKARIGTLTLHSISCPLCSKQLSKTLFAPRLIPPLVVFIVVMGGLAESPFIASPWLGCEGG